MNKIDDGGPAFPVKKIEEKACTTIGGHPLPSVTVEVTYTGLSLRDWFAGQALAGLCHYKSFSNSVQVATDAYQIADVMIALRKERSK